MEEVINKIKILLVEDHGIMRDGIRALLEIQDHIEVVGEAYDGKEAIEKAIELKPDVVLMDISLPGMDGLEATRCIKKKIPRVKVIVLTQYEDKGHVLSAIKSEADGYVPKAAASLELVSAINAVHEGHTFLYPSVARILTQDYRQRVEKEEPSKQLTVREKEILKLIAEGHRSREIAEMLSISLKTVLGHRYKMIRKLDLHNHTELIKYAVRTGTVEY